MNRSLSAVFLTIFFVILSACSQSAEDYLRQGNQLYADGKFADATIIYQKALQSQPGFAEARYRLGLAELAQHKYVEAFMALRDAVQGNISNITDARVKLADLSLAICLTNPDVSEMPRALLRNLATALLKDDPNSFDGNRLSGEIAKLDGNRVSAIEYFRKADAKSPLNRDVSLALTQLLYLEGQTKEAEDIAKRLIAKHPDWGPAYDALARQFVASGRRPDAVKLLQERIAANPKNLVFALQLAEHYLQAGDKAAFESSLNRILASQDYPDRWLLVGDLRTKLKQYEEALRCYSEGLAAFPKEASTYKTRLASTRLLQGNVPEASRLADEALAADPSNQQARLLRANLLLGPGKVGQSASAIADLEKLLEGDPGNSIVLTNLARAQYANGKVVEAMRSLAKAVDRRPDLLEARYFLADISLSASKPKVTLDQADAILARRPKDLAAGILRVRALSKLDRLIDAKEALKILARDYPAAPEVLSQQAALAIQEGRHADAVAIFNRMRADTGGAAVAGLSILQSTKEQYADSIRLLQEQIRKSPNSQSLRELLAANYARAGRHAEAVGEYKALLEKQPDSASLHLGLGGIYDDAQDHNSAMKAYARAAELAPEQPLPLLMLAGAAERAGDVENAIRAYRRTLQLQPGSPVACNNLALILANRGANLDEALDLALKANASAPGQPALKDTLGLIYYKQGKLSEALTIFDGLTTVNPSDPGFHLNQGRVLLAMKRPQEAKAAITASLSLQPSAEQSNLARELLAKLN